MQLSTAGIHNVALVSADAGRSLAFFRDVLGLHLIRRDSAAAEPSLLLGNPGGRPGTLISIVDRPVGGRGRPGIGGVHHTALGVDSEDALLKWKRRLADLGWKVAGPYDRGYFTSIYFRDPDGQVLEIATAGPGYAVDEPAHALGGELKLPEPRIVRGQRDEAAIAALTHPESVPEITPDMELRGIHHVSGITDDLQRAGDFYEAALGLRLVKRTVNRDDPSQPHFFWASYADGDIAPHSSFTLFGWPSHWNRARAGSGQTRLVAFRARDSTELGAWTDQLRGLGVEVSPSPDSPASALRFAAPDGQLLEIVAGGPAFAVDRE